MNKKFDEGLKGFWLKGRCRLDGAEVVCSLEGFSSGVVVCLLDKSVFEIIPNFERADNCRRCQYLAQKLLLVSTRYP